MSFSQQSEQMSAEWEKYMKSLFYCEIFAQRHDESWGLIPCSDSWQNSRIGMTLPFCGAAKQSKVTTCFSANHYLNIHPFNHPVGNRERHLRRWWCLSSDLPLCLSATLLFFLRVPPPPSTLALHLSCFLLPSGRVELSCIFRVKRLISAARDAVQGWQVPQVKGFSPAVLLCWSIFMVPAEVEEACCPCQSILFGI